MSDTLPVVLDIYESTARYHALYTTPENQEQIEAWGFSYSVLMGSMMWVVVEVNSNSIAWILNDEDFHARFTLSEMPSVGS